MVSSDIDVVLKIVFGDPVRLRNAGNIRWAFSRLEGMEISVYCH
jgi:hypothetical protein